MEPLNSNKKLLTLLGLCMERKCSPLKKMLVWIENTIILILLHGILLPSIAFIMANSENIKVAFYAVFTSAAVITSIGVYVSLALKKTSVNDILNELKVIVHKGNIIDVIYFMIFTISL